VKTQRYRITHPLSAVKLEEQPGSSLRKPTETMIQIPAGSVIETEGGPEPSGLVTVLWGSDAFSIFFDDLRDRGVAVDVTAN
jgi:hypothetical protein